MVETLDVLEVAARLPELVRRVAAGNYEVFISKSGTVLAKLVAASPEERALFSVSDEQTLHIESNEQQF